MTKRGKQINRFKTVKVMTVDESRSIRARRGVWQPEYQIVDQKGRAHYTICRDDEDHWWIKDRLGMWIKHCDFHKRLRHKSLASAKSFALGYALTKQNSQI